MTNPNQKSHRLDTPNRRRRGAMVVLLAAMLVMFFVAVAFSVDIAYMHLVRGELRAATDAATKATSETLARTQDVGQAIARGKEIARDNLVAGKGLELADSDIKFGNSTRQADDRFKFVENGRPLNSVLVEGKRTANSRSGSVGLFFGRVLGKGFFEPTERAIATFVERDLVVVVDTSGSMAGQKFADLQRSMQTFISTLKTANLQTRVGLASYSSSGVERVALTSNLDDISRAMSQLQVFGATSISGGMEAGSRIMRGARSGDIIERTMIVMTDGLHNSGGEPEPIAVALANQNVVIHTITFGADADRSRMQRIAQVARGLTFHADNGVQLNKVFRDLALTLSTVITE